MIKQICDLCGDTVHGDDFRRNQFSPLVPAAQFDACPSCATRVKSVDFTVKLGKPVEVDIVVRSKDQPDMDDLLGQLATVPDVLSLVQMSSAVGGVLVLLSGSVSPMEDGFIRVRMGLVFAGKAGREFDVGKDLNIEDFQDSFRECPQGFVMEGSAPGMLALGKCIRLLSKYPWFAVQTAADAFPNAVMKLPADGAGVVAEVTKSILALPRCESVYAGILGQQDLPAVYVRVVDGRVVEAKLTGVCFCRVQVRTGQVWNRHDERFKNSQPVEEGWMFLGFAVSKAGSEGRSFDLDIYGQVKVVLGSTSAPLMLEGKFNLTEIPGYRKSVQVSDRPLPMLGSTHRHLLNIRLAAGIHPFLPKVPEIGDVVLVYTDSKHSVTDQWPVKVVLKAPDPHLYGGVILDAEEVEKLPGLAFAGFWNWSMCRVEASPSLGAARIPIQVRNELIEADRKKKVDKQLKFPNV